MRANSHSGSFGDDENETDDNENVPYCDLIS